LFPCSSQPCGQDVARIQPASQEHRNRNGVTDQAAELPTVDADCAAPLPVFVADFILDGEVLLFRFQPLLVGSGVLPLRRQ
jgi:hypothetical protein